MKIVLNRLLNQIIELNNIYKFRGYLIYFDLKSIEFGKFIKKIFFIDELIKKYIH